MESISLIDRDPTLNDSDGVITTVSWIRPNSRYDF